jgi:hypothetical protein
MDASTGVPEPRERVGFASENRRALSAFLACMPIQGRYAELLVQAHAQANPRGLTAGPRPL